MRREDQQLFISSLVIPAQDAQRKSGVPTSITMAQAILESGWGKSGLAARANNFFGIKARQGEDYAEFKTTEWVNGKPTGMTQHFRRYKSIGESFEAHGKLLGTLARYKPAMAEADDPFVFAARLYECGYSTNPDYAKGLVSLITEFNLTQYDRPASNEPAAA